MSSDKMLTATAIMLALAAPTLSSADAADQESQAQATNDQKIDIVSWAQEDLYTEGWTAEQMFDQDVYGANGEEAGEVENLLIGPDGKLQAVIVESGGFLDLGDTHYRVPWEDVQMPADGEGLTVPVSAENVESYSVFAEDGGAMTAEGFRASELMNDYVSLSDYPGYGMVQDLLFQDGQLSAIIVYPDVGYGVGGPYAYPWYGRGTGWEPGARSYDLPYTRDEIAELGPFDYDRLRLPRPGRPPVDEEARQDQQQQSDQG